ncbi:MAG: LytTR family DNA-binding domain-containing protein [Erysipelothrix sp.]
MKIQISKNISEPITQDQLREAEIVESNGSYVLYAQQPKFPVYDSRRKTFVDIQDIFIVSVIDQRTVVETAYETFFTTLPLKDFETEPLLRISRTTIVNPHYIEDIKVSLNMKYNIRIHNVWHDVNRSYYQKFKKAIGI